MFTGKQTAFSTPVLFLLYKFWLDGQNLLVNKKELCQKWLQKYAPFDTSSSIKSDFVDFEGSLATLPCSALLQALGLARVTGRLRINTEEGSGVIVLLNGVVERSKWMHWRDRESLMQILLLKSGHFVFKSEMVGASAGDKVFLPELLLDAAHREDQLAFVSEDFDGYRIRVSLRSDRLAQHDDLSKMLLSVNAGCHLISCLKILKKLKRAPLTANLLMEQIQINSFQMKESLSLLTRFGLIELRKIQNCSDLDVTVESFSPNAANKSTYQRLQEIVDTESEVSFILIKTLQSSVTKNISNIARNLMSKQDRLYKAADDQLLIVLTQTNSVAAAVFLRELRKATVRRSSQAGNTTHKSCGNFSFFLSAIINSPEDGINVKTLLGKAKLSLRIKKKFGHSAKTDNRLIDFAIPESNAYPGTVLVEF